MAICQREIDWIGNYATPRSEDDPLRQHDSQEDPACHIDLLNRCIKVAPYLEPPEQCAQPMLWHVDLSLQNIMVSDDEDPRILSLLDWQHTAIKPLYLNFCEPTFLQLNYLLPDEEPSFIYKPPLIEEDIKLAKKTARLRELYLQLLNVEFPLGNAVSVPHGELQKMIIRDSGQSWTSRNRIISFRQGLINLWRDWEKYGLKGQPPISFTKEEYALHLEEGKGRNGNQDFVFAILDMIGMTQDGEVKPEEFEEKKREFEEMKVRWVEEMNERGRAAGIDEVIDWGVHWPFRYPDLGF